jgi:hypothetical protein
MIIDHCRNRAEFKEFFEAHPMHDGIMDFHFIYNNPHTFCFYDEQTAELRAYMSFYQDESKRLFMCGASCRKNLLDNINAIIKVCNAFDNDIYADTDKKEAKICLLKAGFKKIDDNLFVRYKR